MNALTRVSIRRKVGVGLASVAMITGLVAVPGTASADGPHECFEWEGRILDDCQSGHVSYGKVKIKNRGKRADRKKVRIIIKDSARQVIARKTMRVRVPAGGTVRVDPLDIIDLSGPEIYIGEFRFIVKEIAPDGSKSKNSTGKFKMVYLFVDPLW